MKVITNNLSDTLLDWAVAKCEGYFDIDMASVHEGVTNVFYFPHWKPSTDWAQGGPIIEREGIELNRYAGEWIATLVTGGVAISEKQGSTQLIAAMRSYVASQLGDEIDIPEELNT